MAASFDFRRDAPKKQSTAAGRQITAIGTVNDLWLSLKEPNTPHEPKYKQTHAIPKSVPVFIALSCRTDGDLVECVRRRFRRSKPLMDCEKRGTNLSLTLVEKKTSTLAV
jgi:hypothetical protein